MYKFLIILNIISLIFFYKFFNENSYNKICEKCIKNMKDKVNADLDFDYDLMLKDYIQNSNSVLKVGVYGFFSFLFFIIIIANMLVIDPIVIPTILIMIIIIYTIMRKPSAVEWSLLNTKDKKLKELDRQLKILNSSKNNISSWLILLYLLYSLIIFITKLHM